MEFEELPQLNHARWGSSVFVYKEKVYCVGGKKARGMFEHSIEELNLAVRSPKDLKWRVISNEGQRANMCWGGPVSI